MSDEVKVNVTWREMRYVIEPLVLPKGSFGAFIEVYRPGPRGGPKRHSKIGPWVIGDSAQKALSDLQTAITTDTLPGVRVVESV